VKSQLGRVLPSALQRPFAMMAKVRRCYHAGVDVINIPDGPRASARVSPMIAAIAMRPSGRHRAGPALLLPRSQPDRHLQSDLLGGYAEGLRISFSSPATRPSWAIIPT